MKLIAKFILLFFTSLFLLFPSKAWAEEIIRNYDVEITAHKDGTMDLIENIAYDFGSDYKHGIYRDIPLVSQVGNLYRIIEINVKKVLRDNIEENYVTNISQSQASIKIGNANLTITGLHTYSIYYSVSNGIGSNYEDHDEIYWNITGNDWKVPIQKASAKLTTDFGVIPDKATCYTGSSGSSSQNCDYSQTDFITSSQSLAPYEGLTGVWSFPKGTFPPSILQKETPDGISKNSNSNLVLAIMIFAVPIFLNLILAPGLLFWYFKHKRKERFGPVTVNFDIPKDNLGTRIAPAEAGSIDIYQVDQNDVIATLFDLAIRKYIMIKQVKKEKVLGVFGDGDEYIFTKLKNINEGTTDFEKTLLERIFEEGFEGDEVKLSSLKDDFYKTFNLFEQDVFDSLIARNYYKKNPKTQMTLLLVLGIFVIFGGGLILGIVLIYLSRKLNGRTALGDEIDWRIDGLKLFLKNMSRNYTWQAKNLYIVEKLIPYAIAFGMIKEFMDQLKVIYPDYHPAWYTGNTNFYLSTNNMFNSMSSSFTTHAPSSSSGFSGGGSSGGGSGGGGGGSW